MNSIHPILAHGMGGGAAGWGFVVLVFIAIASVAVFADRPTRSESRDDAPRKGR